jgi:two-component system sensor histidine kinase MtrB
VLRRRLTIAFALAVGVSAVALAAGSYFVVRHNLLKDSVTTSAKQSRQNLRIAPRYLPDQPAKLLDVYNVIGGFETVLVAGGQPYSGVKVGLRQVPPELRKLVHDGKLAYQRTTVARHPLPRRRGPPTTKVTSTSSIRSRAVARARRPAEHPARRRRCSVVLAALAGAVIAREALRPVAQASEAAHSLAEGLLETRLPVEGRDEFGAWAQAFNEMAGALEAKIAALSAAQARERRFTADVAHELRTPLTALVGGRRCSPSTSSRCRRSRRPAELLIADVGRLRKLVEDLMEISRLQAGAESVNAEPVDLASLTAAILRARGWSERVRLDGEETEVTTDPRRLERIVANLVGNALEHGGGDGVAVRVGRDGSGAFVEVADHGPGIPPEHLPHLFERFTRPTPRGPAAAPASAWRSRTKTPFCLAARSTSAASPARAAPSRFACSETVTRPSQGRCAGGAAWVAMNDTAHRRETRELARRENDGLAVVLLWDPSEDAVTVSVADARTGDRFQLTVDGSRALDAFYHPFAYAA